MQNFEWLLVHYGKAHALFHAVRLGPTFIDIPVCQILIARKTIILRYSQNRIERYIIQLDADRICIKLNIFFLSKHLM